MLERTMRLAVIQLCSTPDTEACKRAAVELARRAVSAGAQVLSFPENTPYLGPEHEARALASSVDGPIVQTYRDLAAELGVVVHLGSFAETGPGDGRIYNTSVLVGSDGETLGVYRKIHLFDVETPNGQVLRESDNIAPGDAQVVVEVGPWRFGLTICYDLRFPELYRGLVEQGANLLLVPAAFTAETGRDHWHPLLRARAIENLSYVAAAGQWGHHFGPRRSYGRSVIFEPWGTSLAVCPDGPGFALAELSLDTLEHHRRRFPCLDHRRV